MGDLQAAINPLASGHKGKASLVPTKGKWGQELESESSPSYPDILLIKMSEWGTAFSSMSLLFPNYPPFPIISCPACMTPHDILRDTKTESIGGCDRVARNSPGPAGALVSDHVLERKTEELAREELEAIVPQLSLF